MPPPDWKTLATESLAAIEAEIARLIVAREALWQLLGIVPAAALPATAIAEPPPGKPHPPTNGTARSAGKALPRILEYLTTHAPERAEEIAEALGLGKSTVLNNRHSHKGLIETVNGVWKLTAAGKAAVKA